MSQAVSAFTGKAYTMPSVPMNVRHLPLEKLH